MTCLRALIRDHRHVALALLLLAFCIKAVVPSGFMISDSNDRLLTITFCSDGSGDGKTLQLVIPGKESEHSNSANKGEHCAFSGLAKVATGGADEILLMMAFAFILVLGLAPLQRQSNLQFFYLRPPLRGPPAVA